MIGAGDDIDEKPAVGSAIRAALEAADDFAFSGEADPFEVRLAHFLANDTGNGQRLIKRFGKDLIYVVDLGWHAWSGKHWSQEDGDQTAMMLAQQTARAIWDEVRELRKELIATGDYHPEKKSGEDKRVSFLKGWALISGNMAKCRAMLDAAEPYLTKRVEALDSEPWKLNLGNGTLHLRKLGRDGRAAVLEKHNRDDLITHLAAVDFDEDAGCPTFDGFLKQVQPIAAVAQFLQVWFGYSLTGLTVERKLAILHGEGRNGKSTLVELIAFILGTYAVKLGIASLLDPGFGKRGEAATPDIARLPGARYVYTGEPDAKARFNSGLIKEMTGNDTMSARKLNEGFFDFKPTHKLIISLNPKPAVDGADQAIWDRICMVPFDVRIPDEDIDLLLAEKLHGEAAGVLNWLIDGFREWNETGLRLPDEVKAATLSYRAESDKIGQFLGAATDRAPRLSVQATKLYQAFVIWCKLNAEDPMTHTGFGKAMSTRGFKREKSGVNFYLGLALNDEFEAKTSAAPPPSPDLD